jgi:hypothetical protein
MLCAAALRYTGYNFSLPYVDHPDEPAYNLAARMIIDFGSPKPLGMQGYPPGIIAVNYVLLRLFHDPATPPSTVIWMVRLIAITFSVMTVPLIALVGFRISTPLAGLFAAALYAVTTELIEFSRYASADDFVVFFILLAIYLSLTATRYDRDRLTTWSMVAMMFAIVFKYQALFILPLILVAPLWRLREGGAERRRIVKNFAVNLGVLAVFFFWLVFLFPFTEAGQSPHWAAPVDHLGLPSLAILVGNARTMFDPLGASNLWTIALVGLCLLAFPAVRGRMWLFGIAIVALNVVVSHVAISMFGEQLFRQFLPQIALLMVLAGAGLGAWAVALASVLSRVRLPHIEQRRVAASGLLVSVLVAAALIPQVNSSIANAKRHTLPDRRNDLARWADITLAPGSYIAEQDNHKTLDGAWGGYAGLNSFHIVERAHIDDRPIQAWRDEGVTFAIESYRYYQDLLETPEGRALLDQTTLLKSYPSSSRFRGPSMVVLSLYPIQQPMDAAFGPIRLVGCDVDRNEVAPGESVTFTMYWQADAPLDADYAVFNHLVSSGGDMVAQIDGSPMPDERRPTTTWDDPDETLVSRPFVLTIGEDVPPGTYELHTGFYRRDNGARLPMPDGSDSLALTTITVTE